MADTTEKPRTRQRREREPAEPQASLGTDGPVGPEQAAIDEALEQIRHRRGCPGTGMGLEDEGSRMEVIRHKVSGGGLDQDRGGSTDGVTALIVRCVECGAQYPDE